MSEGKKIVACMLAAQGIEENKKSDIVVGTVISISPLTVKVDDKLTLPEDLLVVGALCQETIITPTSITEAGHTHVNGGGVTTADISGISKIRLWRGLKKDDVVYMIKFKKGQLYYILQRKEGIIE